MKAAIQILERLQTMTYIKFDLLENRSQVQHILQDQYILKNRDCVCP